MNLDEKQIIEQVNKIREIISMGRMDDAIDSLSELSLSIYSSSFKTHFEEINLRNNVIDIEAKWNKLEDEYSRELMTQEQNKIGRSQIQNRVLDFLSDIEEHAGKQHTSPVQSNFNEGYLKWIGLLILIFLCGFLVIRGCNNKSELPPTKDPVPVQNAMIKNAKINFVNIDPDVDCPALVHYSSKITSNKQGRIKYQIKSNSGYNSGPKSIYFPQPSTQLVKGYFKAGIPGQISKLKLRLEILEPEIFTTHSKEINLNCPN